MSGSGTDPVAPVAIEVLMRSAPAEQVEQLRDVAAEDLRGLVIRLLDELGRQRSEPGPRDRTALAAAGPSVTGSEPSWVLSRAVEIAAEMSGLDAVEVAGRGRARPIADARAVAHAAARAWGLTLVEIAEHAGGLHHTSVMHSVRKVAASDRLRIRQAKVHSALRREALDAMAVPA